MLYLYAITIPHAPMFNMLGRYLAWLSIPNGIGALWFAGHPIKGFNIISLFIVALLAVYIMRKKILIRMAGNPIRNVRVEGSGI
jgi:hypothetical protein